jgi:hypothetical protein
VNSARTGNSARIGSVVVLSIALIDPELELELEVDAVDGGDGGLACVRCGPRLRT